MRHIILDTDPGVDDALAILLAERHPAIAMHGITTVYGNSTVAHSTTNALTILELIQSSTKVYQGAHVPLFGSPVLASCHGDNGLGGFSLPTIKKKAESMNAIEYLISQLDSASEPLTLVCIGPITNLALVLNLRPDLQYKIQEIVILAGVIYEKGNITAVADFNTINDPYALDIVLSLQTKKILIPINVCRKVLFTKRDFDSVQNKSFAKRLKRIIDIYISYYANDTIHGGFSGGVMYDVLAIAYLIDSAMFTTREERIEVETMPSKTFGQTFISLSGKPNTTLVTDVDSTGVKRLFFDTLNAA